MSQIIKLNEAHQAQVEKYFYSDFWGCIELIKCYEKAGLKYQIANKDSGVYYGYFEEKLLLGVFLFTNNKRCLLHFKSEQVTRKVDLLKAIKFHKPEYMSGPADMVALIWKMFERTVKRYNYKNSMYMVLNEKLLDFSVDQQIVEATFNVAKASSNFLVAVEKHFGRNHMTINQIQKRIELKMGTGEYLFAQCDHQVVGQGFVEEKVKAFWQIGGVFVVPNKRGIGLARKLVCTLIQTIQSQGCIPILAVLKDNHSAVSLYESIGFVESIEFSIIEIEF
ncbi:MAG: GNAT family N-acetyltransferase [Clostridia bacterium]|nr:GNAT family N-acetyltransferase [Clostridia bacterium]